jgi:hypothetical protein
MQKYGFDDARPVLERASARETAARVALGAVARAFLAQTVVAEVLSHVVELGAAAAPFGVVPQRGDSGRIDADPVRCLDPEASAAMVAEVDAARRDGDTLGGVVEVVVHGLPPGLGSHVHWDRRLDAKLAAALHGARHVAYSSPWKDEKSAQAMIIHDILQRPEFSGTHEALIMNGNGVKGIKDGADIALQLVCETRDPAVSVVGPLPQDLHAWLDGDVAVSARTPDAKAAADFIAYITRPAAAPVWKAKGLDRS